MMRARRSHVRRLAALVGVLALALQGLAALPAMAAGSDGSIITVCTGTGFATIDLETGQPAAEHPQAGHCCVAAGTPALTAPAAVSEPAALKAEAVLTCVHADHPIAARAPRRPPSQAPPSTLNV